MREGIAIGSVLLCTSAKSGSSAATSACPRLGCAKCMPSRAPGVTMDSALCCLRLTHGEPGKGGYLVDPASSHMLVSKIKPCMSKYERSSL